MNRFFKLLTLALFIMTLAGCTGRKSEEKVVAAIDFSSYETTDIAEMPDGLIPDLNYVVLNLSEEFAFVSMDKVLYKNGLFYILDFRTRHILVFDEEGNGQFVLSRQGRGPQEYLQVSDFDIDEEGGFWVLDAQNDAVLHYLADGTFASATKTSVECSFIKYVKEDLLLLAVSSWDKKEGAETKVVLADTNMTILDRYAFGTMEHDSNMTFPSFGFCTVGPRTYYVSEGIDDNVAVFDDNGGFDGLIKYDFGVRTVPEDARLAIEDHMDDFYDYTFVTKTSVLIGGNVVLGTVFEGDTFNDFVIDLESGILYKQGEASQGLFLMGVSGGRVLYTIRPDLDEVSYPQLPAEIQEAFDGGEAIIAYRNIK